MIDLASIEDDDSPYELVGQPRRPAMVGTRPASGSKVRADGAAPVALTEDEAETTASRTPMQILAAFRGEIEPVRPTPLYRLMVAAVAGFMLTLPMVYLAIIGVVGYGVYYHLVNHVGMLSAVDGRGGRAQVMIFFLYLAPAIVGGALVAFLFKPFLARPGRGDKSRSLDPSKEPLLFAFVDGVCSTVGARTPGRIDVDCQVNASAASRAGRSRSWTATSS